MAATEQDATDHGDGDGTPAWMYLAVVAVVLAALLWTNPTLLVGS